MTTFARALQPWEIPDRRSLVAYLKWLSSEELTDWCLARLAAEAAGMPDAFLDACRNGHLRSSYMEFRPDHRMICRACIRDEHLRRALKTVREAREKTKCG